MGQGKHHIVNLARLLTLQAVIDRGCGYFDYEHKAHLAVTETVA
jgi:hypothetical protein